MNPTMKSLGNLTFRIASEEGDFEQINRLNYKTFVDEIPQHPGNPSGVLVDRFDRENTYIICRTGEDLFGMVAVRGKRPFSLDDKLENLDSYLPNGHSACEIRLLSVERDHRNGTIFRGLVGFLAQHCRTLGYDLAVISGALKQHRLYEQLGFVPFGPLVGEPGAQFQPMYLTLEEFEKRSKSLIRRRPGRATARRPVNLLPGPVTIGRDVGKAFVETPVSHRSETFMHDFQQTRRLLCDLVGSKHVEILAGSGTLANDVIAAQLSRNPTRGLILSNGEFGDRLIDQATRFRLPFEKLQIEWGRPFLRDEIEHCLEKPPSVGWLWSVHCETSSGVLNDLAALTEICAARQLLLCIDSISSIGTTPVDLSGVYLASGVSGKGLGSYPGLSMVFYNQPISPAPDTLPRYLDLGLYASNEGVPFTISSNLLYALRTALKRFEPQRTFDHIGELSDWLRARLRELGFVIVAPDGHNSPAVVTLALPPTISSERVGRELEEAGYFLSYKSRYLLERNWIQVCLMGECSRDDIVPLLDALQKFGIGI